LGRLVWAVADHDKKTRGQFFDLLGSERCAEVRLGSTDAAEWINEVVKERCANATMCSESFHVVSWATEVLDEVRQEVWNGARRFGVRSHAADLKEARCAPWKNSEDPTVCREANLACVASSRIPAFVEFGRKIRKNLPSIEAVMLNDLSNALIESTNTKLRVLHRMAFGFKDPEHLIALELG
jgi:transposase